MYKKEGKRAFVMTNNHVVDGADSIKLILSNNEEIDKILSTFRNNEVTPIAMEDVLDDMFANTKI